MTTREETKPRNRRQGPGRPRKATRSREQAEDQSGYAVDTEAMVSEAELRALGWMSIRRVTPANLDAAGCTETANPGEIDWFGEDE